METIFISGLSVQNWTQFSGDILAIETAVYEPSRRDSEESLKRIVGLPRNICAVCCMGETPIGYTFGAPLEFFNDVKGTRDDPEWGKGTSLYSADIAVSPAFRQEQIGTMLKLYQIRHALSLGYEFVSSRNRITLASSMLRINQKFGAQIVTQVRNAYSDSLGHQDSLYMQLDLRRLVWERVFTSLRPAALAALRTSIADVRVGALVTGS